MKLKKIKIAIYLLFIFSKKTSSPLFSWTFLFVISPQFLFHLKKKSPLFFQPGLIKIRTSVHFLCDTVLRTLLHVSPQFQREMSTEWR